MASILVCKEDEQMVLTKSNAYRFKTVDLSNIKCGDAFELVEDQNDFNKLIGVPADIEDEEPMYTILTNEFGLYAMDKDVSAKIKVSFCDNGMMLVTVIEGAVLIKPADDILLASRGVEELPDVKLDNVLWVDAEKILAYAKYWGNVKGRLTQDFEFMFNVKGKVLNGYSSFGIKSIEEEDVDISGGYSIILENEILAKEQARNIKKEFNSMTQKVSSSYTFDDDDEDEIYYEEDDDEDFDDGSNY